MSKADGIAVRRLTQEKARKCQWGGYLEQFVADPAPGLRKEAKQSTVSHVCFPFFFFKKKKPYIIPYATAYA